MARNDTLFFSIQRRRARVALGRVTNLAALYCMVFGVPRLNRVRAGKVPGSGFDGLLPSTQGHGLDPKNAGLLGR